MYRVVRFDFNVLVVVCSMALPNRIVDDVVMFLIINQDQG